MDKFSFKEFKKKFEKWQNNPLVITYPEREIMIQPYGKNYRIYRVICKHGKMAVNYKYVTTFKHFKILDKWRKADYTIGYCMFSLPFLK